MDTYFPTANNQIDGVATPYTVDPKIDSYSEIRLCSNRIVMGLNQVTAHEFYSTASIGMSQSPSNCVEEAMEARCEMAFIPEFGDPLGRQNIQCGGLSLSLGSKTPLSAVNQSAMEMEYFPTSSSLATLGKVNSNVYDHLDCSVLASPGLDSKYVKAAQQLLDEVVNVRAVLNELISNKNKSFLYSSNDNIGRSNGGSLDVSCHELSSEERQDLKNKSAKLLAMVEEVDERYRQYYQQMQILASSFDTISGWGAAELYTALAHQTISRHFRRLRDGISDQIQVMRRRLGEEDCSSGSQRGFPRIRNVDQKLRQDRALQQLGLTRHSWRPQRGLPESSVSILRAWLFEHFLHPYPKDSEKLMLAKQTGLTRHQVANWFINARVRLWKPMVEEMYKEEFGDPKTGFNFSPENTFRAPEDSEEDLQDGRISSNADGEQIQEPEPKSNENDENAENIASTTLCPREIILPSQVSLALELRHCESSAFSKQDGVHNAEDSPMGNCRLGSPHLLHDLVGL